ncbi:MAG: lipid-transfer protein [Actinomycetota bacterium]|nr:lipid-transfer protein [Actinomycetota bacterium]
MAEGPGRHDVAIVSTAVHQVEAFTGVNEVQLMVGLINQAREAAGLTQAEVGFTCSGSSDFLAGQAFSFVQTLDAVGAFPPISESHVEMDGAFALYEAWVKLQIGEVDTALVYSYGKPSAGSVRDVLALQLDPYYLAPLWPDAHALAALQARLLLESGRATPETMAQVAVRSLHNATTNANAVRASATATVDQVLDTLPVADPLRPADLAQVADGGCAVVLARGQRARSLCDRPAWIRGIDHRIDSHALGARDLTRSKSAAVAAGMAGVSSDRLDIAEIHGSTTSQELILEQELGITPATAVNPSGGALAADTLMASGLIRIAKAADRVSDGSADRALAHATSGPCLQQNLVCVLEGD